MEGHVVMTHRRADVLLVVLERLSFSVMLGTREHGKLERTWCGRGEDELEVGEERRGEEWWKRVLLC